ncbi:hypothetical protein ONR57_10340 [Hoyosella sp. YIM 151337]|uniref:hypothetical protein n=1 Tax=Hoyosella sp. YIM 151337 TaxID=2992742 RepID=UPI002235AED5|nr:hypothetical protein [Hoyosella sp. YIM 151337]MCW4353694.1 hypothetical protein [Hoyosella sp. YIM 151337]
MSDYTNPSRLRWALSLTALAATVPYLALKGHWIFGGRTGLTDPDFGTSPVMAGFNAATAAMEAAAIVLALAFVMPWGRRVPALVIVAPMWVATGLLGQILLTLPIQLALMTLAGSPLSDPGPGPIEAWVFTMVYGGFAVLGVCLISGFIMYARSRWSDAQRWQAQLSTVGRPHFAAAAALLLLAALIVAASTDLLNATAAAAALPAGEITIYGIGVCSVLMIATGKPRSVRRWMPIFGAFLASGALTAWGSYLLIVMLIPNDLMAEADVTTAALAIAAAKVLSGVVCAIVLWRFTGAATRAVAHTGWSAQSRTAAATNS